MRLKSLTLTGYKTFADKTQFEFDSGITAVIGPNGSGKSNVADAIRWSLGEQAFSVLRGKKTDDMIFSGSAKRPRASMAEVLLTFDNSDGFFPIEFQEVSIGRRAYRDGLNEYVLNGNRVRLRDVADLLSHTGLAERTYTVIGQGLVDNALSQKPEERRALFEEAAGIATYRDKRDDALRKLEETQLNLNRARDILSEITPRIKTLERQAERARQYLTLAADLETHTRISFAYHYQKLKSAIAQSSQSREAAKQHVADALRVVETLEGEISQLRAEQANARSRLIEIAPNRDELRQRHEQSSRELAVLRERDSSLQMQISTAQREIEERSQTITQLEERIARAQEELNIAETTLSQRQVELDAAQQEAAEYRAARVQIERQRGSAQQEAMRLNALVASAQNRVTLLRSRQGAVSSLQMELSARLARFTEQRERDQATLISLNQNIEQDVTQLQRIKTELESAQRELETARTMASSAQSDFAAAEAEAKMAERMNAFVELRAQANESDLSGLTRVAELPEFRGTLGALIQIHPDDERAVRAALGEFLNAVVIESSDGVTQTRAWLATLNANDKRLTLVATPTLREEDFTLRAAMAAARAMQTQPVFDLISAPDWLKPALRWIVGRAFLARDFESAQRISTQLPAGCVCVTRDGDVVHASGVMSLASGARAAMVLGASESDGAELLIDPEQANLKLTHARERRDTAHYALNAARAKVDETARQHTLIERDATARRIKRDDHTRTLQRLEDQFNQTNNEAARLEREQSELTEQTSEIAKQLSLDEEHQQLAAQRLSALDTQLREQAESNMQIGLFAAESEAEPHTRGWMDTLNDATAAVATATANARAAQANLSALRAELRGATDARAMRVSRLGELDGSQNTTVEKLHMLSATTEQSSQELRRIEDLLAPLQTEINAIDQRVFASDTRRREAERTLREAESRLNGFELELARHQDEQAALHERALDAFADKLIADKPAPVADGIAPTEVTETPPPSPQALLRDYLEQLPQTDELPSGTDERVATLRNQIKRLGSINTEAQSEYDELSTRHTFLSEQSGDLEKAVESLQHIIGELNVVMHTTFKQTFESIAHHFQNAFKVLFGGGQAKLSLVNADNLDEAGIDILAQPPGKRPQSLALLSGGERSLTASALLFAILHVKPTPFCVLDEVDAALDEANVGRFRSMLESLTDKTQFIVITHNRRTVEAAQTIYGISMGADSASIALSLHLDEAQATMKNK